jgi:hypothetical protein
MAKKKIQPVEGQSLLDIAVQTSGSVEGVVSLSKLNKLPITAPIDMWRLIDEAEEIDRRRRKYFELREIFPATELKPPVDAIEGLFGEEFGVEFE